MNTLNDKIVTIIDALGFSNTKFADAISVSRPTISHILSGRNKPSIDIIQKILAKYPELGYKWFLDDEELDHKNLSQLANSQGDHGHSESNATLLDSSIQDKPVRQPTNTLAKSRPSTENSEVIRRVERIIMFYSDGSMEVLSGAPQVL
jgi:transcriptional regulator with XRE-family HTH domain